MAAVGDLRSFIELTVYARGSVTGFLAALTIAALGPSRILILGAIDLAAAVWIALCRRAERRAVSQGIEQFLGRPQVHFERAAA